MSSTLAALGLVSDPVRDINPWLCYARGPRSIATLFHSHKGRFSRRRDLLTTASGSSALGGSRLRRGKTSRCIQSGLRAACAEGALVDVRGARHCPLTGAEIPRHPTIPSRAQG